MAQKLYVEKPLKVLGEQYTAGSTPVGLCTCTVTIFFPDGRPHVHTEQGVKEPHDTDMIVSSAYKPGVVLEVLALAEFEDRFGNVPG